MGLVDRVFAEHRRRGALSWPVGKGALIGPEERYGHSQAEFAPTEYGDYLATSNDIYSVAQRRARLMSSLKLKFYRGRDSEKKEVDGHPAVNLWWYVNPFWTAERLARMDELSMCVWGETCWAIEYDRGRPREIWWMKPSRVNPVPDSLGYIKGYVYESVSGELIRFEPHEVIWFRYPNPLDEFSPLSPLAASRLAADTSVAMMKSNEQLFSQGMQAAGLIVPSTDKVTFTNEQADDLELHLRKKLTGSKNAHKWAVMRYEAQFKQLSISPKDAEFAAGLGLTFQQVCRAYGMQSVLMNDLQHSTLANATAFERIEWTGALKPDSEFRAAEVREQYLPLFRSVQGGGPDFCEYDFSQVASLQESASESWAREAQAMDRGAITINEWRENKGMGPVPWGDRPYMPVNKAPLAPDGSLELPDTGQDKPPDDERNPSVQPDRSGLNHMAARRLLAQFTPYLNGHQLEGILR